MKKIIYKPYSHFQEESSALKHVLFGNYMNTLWIFEDLTPKGSKAIFRPF
jgi:hypothetical protein